VGELQAEVDSLRAVLVEKYTQVADNLEGECAFYGARSSCECII